MYCSHCGNQISDDSRFCPVCGVALEKPAEERKETAEQQNTASYTTYTDNSTYYQTGNGYAPQTTNIIAVLGFVLSFFSPLIGFILSFIGLGQIKRNPNQKGRGLAIAGIILSVCIFLLVAFCYLILFLGLSEGY